MSELVPVSRDYHSAQIWRRFESYAFVQDHPLVPIVLGEHEALATTLPLVLVQAQGALLPMALTRLGPRTALVAPNGVWRGACLPAILRVHPFRATPPDASGQVGLLVDQASDLLAPRAAHPLAAGWEEFFTETGALAPVLADLLAFFRTRAVAERQTAAAVAALAEAGVLTPVAPYPVPPLPEGLLWIDAQALAGKGRTVLSSLHRTGALGLAHAMLVARHHMPFLAQAEAALGSIPPLGGPLTAPPPPEDAGLASFLSAVAAARARDTPP